MTRPRLGFTWGTFAITAAALMFVVWYWSILTGAGARPTEVTTSQPTSRSLPSARDTSSITSRGLPTMSETVTPTT